MEKIRIVEGKSGSKLDGRFLMMVPDIGPEGSELIRTSGAIEAGKKDGLSIWLLPAGSTADQARSLRDDILSAVDAPARDAPDTNEAGPTEPVPMDAPRETSPSSATGQVDPALPPEASGENPEDAGEPTREDMSGDGENPGDQIGNGYRLGMSIAERDRHRRPVPAGTVGPGEAIGTPTGDREVLFVSGVIHMTPDRAREMRERFPDADCIDAGSDIQLAAWSAEPEADHPTL